MSFAVIQFETWLRLTDAAGPALDRWPEDLVLADLRQHQAASLFHRIRWPSLREWQARWRWSKRRVIRVLRQVDVWSELKLRERWEDYYERVIRKRCGGPRGGGRPRRPLATLPHPQLDQTPKEPAPARQDPSPEELALETACLELLAGGLTPDDHRALSIRDRMTLQALRTLIRAGSAWPEGTRLRTLGYLVQRVLEQAPPPVRADVAPLRARALAAVAPASGPRAQDPHDWRHVGGGEPGAGAQRGRELAAAVLGAADPWSEAEPDVLDAALELGAARQYELAGDASEAEQELLAGARDAGLDPDALIAGRGDVAATRRGRGLGLKVALFLAGGPDDPGAAWARTWLVGVLERARAGPLLEEDQAAMAALAAAGVDARAVLADEGELGEE